MSYHLFSLTAEAKASEDTSTPEPLSQSPCFSPWALMSKNLSRILIFENHCKTLYVLKYVEKNEKLDLQKMLTIKIWPIPIHGHFDP